MEKATSIERTAGNVVTQAAFAAIAAQVATPLVALLPSLANSLAANRHQKRVEAAIQSIESQLQANMRAIEGLTDDQFKLINEVVLAILQTTEEEKLTYLKQAITNGLTGDIDLSQSTPLSRMLREISAAELKFLVDNFQYEKMLFDVAPSEEQARRIDGDSPDGIAVTGLISLGLIVPAGSTIDSMGVYRFSPLVAKLIALVQG